MRSVLPVASFKPKKTILESAAQGVQLKNVGDTSYDANFVVSVEFLHSQNLS